MKLSAWEKAKRYGVDTALLEFNLKRTPTERILAIQDAANFVEALRQAYKKYYAKLRKNNRSPS